MNVGRSVFARGAASVVVAIVGTAASCGGESVVDSGSPGLQTEAEHEIYLQMIELGATEDEATCIAIGLADGAETIDEAEERNPTAHFESLAQVLEALVPECASPERFAEFDAAQAAELYEAMQEIEDYFATVRADFYRQGGASDEEAECMGRIAVISEPGDVPANDVYDADDPQLEIFSTCASTERIAEIYARNFYLSTAVNNQLVAAGATERQASCITISLPDLLLLFPDGNFDHERSVSMTVAALVDDAADCAGETELEAIARELHRRYES